MSGGLGAIVMAVIAIVVFKTPPEEALKNLTQQQGQAQQGPAKPQTEREKEIDEFVRSI